MYTRKQLDLQIKKARGEGDEELITMLEHYHQLRFTWIPQIKKRFLGPNHNGDFTPHQSVLREEVVLEWAKKYKLL